MKTIKQVVKESARNKALHKQFIKFGIVGVANTVIDWTVYFILSRFVPFFASNLVYAKAISFLFGVTNSYYWNRKWTFRSLNNSLSIFIPFFMLNVVSIIINTGVMFVALTYLSLPEIIALGSATAVTLLWNFVGSKLFVFKA